jgi:hypothetical protein
MYRLRLKFVEQAKTYLGIPYAKKYFEPGSKQKEFLFNKTINYL